MFEPAVEAAIERCVAWNIPFAVYAMPGDNEFRFMASMPDSDTGNNRVDFDEDEFFGINFFNNEEEYLAGVKPRLSASDILGLDGVKTVLPSGSLPMGHLSTPRLLYIHRLKSVIAALKRSATGDKTVVSRLVSVFSRIDLCDVARCYFGMFPETFRYICFTQEIGLWLGATPEVLLEHDPASHTWRTMSLAGTRRVALVHPTGWDEKNITEHDIVTRYIVRTLEQHGLDCSVSVQRELGYGEIEHLCNDITASGETEAADLLYALSPTPAVAGYPLDRAIDMIDMTEMHSRHCYGGFLCVKSRDGMHAFVNLRCAHVSRLLDGLWHWNIYAGGGVTRDSDPAVEWDETEAKCRRLLESVNPLDGSVTDVMLPF